MSICYILGTFLFNTNMQSQHYYLLFTKEETKVLVTQLIRSRPKIKLPSSKGNSFRAIKYFLRTCYVPGTVLGARNIEVNMVALSTILVEKDRIKETNKKNIRVQSIK